MTVRIGKVNYKARNIKTIPRPLCSKTTNQFRLAVNEMIEKFPDMQDFSIVVQDKDGWMVHYKATTMPPECLARWSEELIRTKVTESGLL